MWSHVVAVTNRHLVEGDFFKQIERVCAQHPKALIVREKDLPEPDYEQLAKKCLDICKDSNVTCILHFYPDAAIRLGCRQIHLPLWKLEQWKTETKNSLPFEKIGVSIHSIEEARRAQELGASYLTAGHIFPTDCKKGVPARGLDFLADVCQSVHIPVYGIGGIKLDETQIASVLNVGASGVCVMSGAMQI